MLNCLFLLIDTASESAGLEQVTPTVGDAYLATAGLVRESRYHAHMACRAAVLIQVFFRNFLFLEIFFLNFFFNEIFKLASFHLKILF
jgi:hypothetical protein